MPRLSRPTVSPRDLMLRRRLSRRALLSASARAGVGAAGLALVGCGEDEPEVEDDLQAQQQDQQSQAAQEQDSQTDQTQQAQTTQQDDAQTEQADQAEQSAPSGPTAGGVLRMWLPTERHDRWDPHRSRFRYTQAMQSLMYNRLLRPASVSSGELESDLCALPETPDETTYIFSIVVGAKFWDREPTNGRAFSAEDIRFNIERQRAGVDATLAPEPLFFRRSAYQRVDNVEAVDDITAKISTAAVDGSFLSSVVSSPFAWMISPEGLEAWGDDWRDDPSDIQRNSGTGPYTPLSYAPGEEAAFGRSENWWLPESAWPDGIVFAGGPTTQIIDQYWAAELDRVDFPITNEAVRSLREERPDDAQFSLPLDAPVQLLTPLDSAAAAPLGDPRVLRAVGIAVDRQRLLQRLYGGDGQASGPLPWYLDGWALPDERLATFPGYRADRAEDTVEIANLVAAAGGPEVIGELPLVVADLFEGFFAGAGAAAQAMIEEATGVTLELEFRPYAEALGALAEGERFLFLSWGEAPQVADPTDRWRDTLHSAGTRNWGGVPDPELDALIDQMTETLEIEARRDLAAQAQERLLSGDAGQWMVNLVNGTQLGIAQPWLNLDPRALEFGWSSHRLADSWINTANTDYPAERVLPDPPETEAEQAQEGEEAQQDGSDGG